MIPFYKRCFTRQKAVSWTCEQYEFSKAADFAKAELLKDLRNTV